MLSVTFCHAQKVTADYQLIPVTNNHTTYTNSKLQKELQKAHKKLAKKSMWSLATVPKK